MKQFITWWTQFLSIDQKLQLVMYDIIKSQLGQSMPCNMSSDKVLYNVDLHKDNCSSLNSSAWLHCGAIKKLTTIIKSYKNN